jgi:hypothetical protein
MPHPKKHGQLIKAIYRPARQDEVIAIQAFIRKVNEMTSERTKLFFLYDRDPAVIERAIENCDLRVLDDGNIRFTLATYDNSEDTVCIECGSAASDLDPGFGLLPPLFDFQVANVALQYAGLSPHQLFCLIHRANDVANTAAHVSGFVAAQPSPEHRLFLGKRYTMEKEFYMFTHEATARALRRVIKCGPEFIRENKNTGEAIRVTVNFPWIEDENWKSDLEQIAKRFEDVARDTKNN